MQPQLNEKLRTWWSHRQGLDGGLADAAPAEVLERTGWARSVGGVGPYLTLFARAGTSREATDGAVANLEIHELPSARGCTYVVPTSEFALALKAGESFAGGEMKTAYKLGVTDQEVDKLCARSHDPGDLPGDVQHVRASLGRKGNVFLKDRHRYLPKSASKAAIFPSRRRWRSAPEKCAPA